MGDYDEIKLKDFMGFAISVAPWNGHFFAVKGDVKYDANTLNELVEIIKRHESNARHFKPFDVIRVSDNRVGRITSRVASSRGGREEVYFTFKRSDEEKASRSAESLEGSRWDGDDVGRFALLTDENTRILGLIQCAEKDLQMVNDTIRTLRKSFKDRVTWEMIEAAEAEAEKKRKTKGKGGDKGTFEINADKSTTEDLKENVEKWGE